MAQTEKRLSEKLRRGTIETRAGERFEFFRSGRGEDEPTATSPAGFVLHVRPGERIRTREPSDAGTNAEKEVEGTHLRSIVCRPVERSGETSHADRAVWESRVTALAAGVLGGAAPTSDEFDRVPYPVLDPAGAAQLGALYRWKRVAAPGAGRIDWAIERVVAEAYDLKLSDLVRLQRLFGPERSG